MARFVQEAERRPRGRDPRAFACAVVRLQPRESGGKGAQCGGRCRDDAQDDQQPLVFPRPLLCPTHCRSRHVPRLGHCVKRRYLRWPALRIRYPARIENPRERSVGRAAAFDVEPASSGVVPWPRALRRVPRGTGDIRLTSQRAAPRGCPVLHHVAHQTVHDHDPSANLGRLRGCRVAAASCGGRDDRNEVRHVLGDADGRVIRHPAVPGQDRLPNPLA
jgi:hypothetical protein